MAEELELRATLRDELTRGLRGIRSEIDKTTRSIPGVTKVGGAAGKSLSKMGSLGKSAMSGLGRAAKVGTVAAVTGLAVLGTKAVTTASDVGESVNKTNVIFGEASKGVQAWADTTGTSLGIAKGEALDAAAGMGGLFKAAGKTDAGAAKLGMSMTELAADTGSFFNATTPEVLEAFQSGLSGETEPLRKFGVFLNEAKVQAEGLRMGLVKGKEEMTDEQKILARQAIIMRETAKAHGDFGETVGTSLPNTMKVLKATFTDTIGTIGQAMLPVLLEVAKVVQGTIGPALESLGPALTQVVGAFGKALGPILQVVTPLLKILAPLFADIARILTPIITLIGRLLTNAIRQLMPVLRPLIGALGQALLQILRAIAPVLPDIVRAMVALLTAITPLIPIVASVAAVLAGMLANGLSVIIRLLANVIEWVTKFVGSLGGAWGTVKQWAGNVVGFFAGLPGKLASAASGLWDWLKDSFKGAINSIIGWWNDLELTINPPGPGSFTIGTPDLPTLAGGGSLRAGEMAVVGEQGPELYVPDVGGRVVPAPQAREIIRSMPGEGSVTLNGPLIGNVNATSEIDVERAALRAWKRLERDRHERAHTGRID